MSPRTLSFTVLALSLAIFAWDQGEAILWAGSVGTALLSLRFWVLPLLSHGPPSTQLRRSLNSIVLVAGWIGLLVFLFTDLIPLPTFLPITLLGGVWWVLVQEPGRFSDTLLAGGATLASIFVLAICDLPPDGMLAAAGILGGLLLWVFSALDRERITEILEDGTPQARIRLDPLVVLILVILAWPLAVGLPTPNRTPDILDEEFVQSLGRITGFTVRVDLSSLGDLKVSDARALRVRVEEFPKLKAWNEDDENTGNRHPLLLRGSVLGNFDGRRFTALSPPDRYGETFGEHENKSLGFIKVRQRVVMAPHGRRELFALDRVIGRSTGCVREHGELRSIKRVTEPPDFFEYTVDSRILPPTQRKFLALHRATHPDRRYRSYQRRTAARIKRLANEVVVSAGATHDYSKILAVHRWLKHEGGFSYTRLNENDGPRPLERFLFDTRQGHCEFFASSMVVMLRTLGIPARLAVGFRGGTWNERVGAFEVLMRNAHAWVEVPFENVGWVYFDATPAESRLDLIVEKPELGGANDTTVPIAPRANPQAEADHLPWGAWGIAAGGVLLVGFGAWLLRRRRGDGPAWSTADQTTRALRRRLLALLRRFGGKPRRSTTLLELTGEAPRVPPDALPGLRWIVGLLYRSRFGLRSPTVEEVEGADQTLASLEQEVTRAARR